MGETQPPRRILQSIGAVFAGLVAVFVLSLGTDVGATRDRDLSAMV